MSEMKTITTMLVAIMLSMTLISQNAPVTFIGTIEVNTTPGQVIEVPINTTGLYNVTAISLTFRYNPNALEFIEMVSPSYPNLYAGNVAGVTRIGGFNNAGATVPVGALCVLKYTYKGGQSKLELYDDGASCEYAGQNGNALNDKPTAQYYLSGYLVPVVAIGTQVWMSENLNVGEMVNSGTNQTNNSKVQKYCWDNNPANCEIDGGLYQWDEMMNYNTAEGSQGICPNGWRIPTTVDFEQLAKFTRVDTSEQYTTYIGTGWKNDGSWYNQSGIALKGATYTARGKDPAGNPIQVTNSTGFNAIKNGNYYMGFRNGPRNKFFVGQWWTSSLVAGKNIATNYGNDNALYPIYWQVNQSNNALAPAGAYKNHGYPVRCIKQ